MPITPEHRSAETRFRELLSSADIPQPDAVEYEPDSVLFLWHDLKLAVFVDLVTGEPRDPDRRPQARGYSTPGNQTPKRRQSPGRVSGCMSRP
jgi:hypothetical protein